MDADYGDHQLYPLPESLYPPAPSGSHSKRALPDDFDSPLSAAPGLGAGLIIEDPTADDYDESDSPPKKGKKVRNAVPFMVPDSSHSSLARQPLGVERSTSVISKRRYVSTDAACLSLVPHPPFQAKRHISFSKRKAGIMKKAYELSTLTGTQVLLLVVSETGLVYTFTVSDTCCRRQPHMVLICSASPDGQA
jgi:hypothetical protein